MGTLCQAQAHRYARGLQVVYTLGLGCKAREEQRLFLCLLPSVHLILLNQIRQRRGLKFKVIVFFLRPFHF